MKSCRNNCCTMCPATWIALIIALLFALGVFNSCAKRSAGDQSAELHQLFDDYWEFNMREFPTWATSLGDRRYDSLLSDVSEEANERRHQQMLKFRERLNAFDRTSFSETDKVSADIFLLEMERNIEGYKFKGRYMPVNQQGGPQLALATLISQIPFTTEQDFINYNKRMRAFPQFVDQHIANMRKGMTEGIVSSKINIEPVIEQMEGMIADDPRQSVFYSPIRDDEELDEQVLSELSDQYVDDIQNSVMPAYRKLQTFLRDEYLPVCRDEFGVWSLPDGAERYDYLIKFHTTLPLTPEEIAQMGMDDLARIEAEMDAIISKVGFKGARAEFFNYLHNDARFYYTDKDSLLAGYSAILNAIKPKIPELFGILPKADCVVKEMEEYRTKTAPTAYYNQPAEDGSRPGYFYANTYDLKARPKYEMEALTYHEAIPGHHLQIAIQQERENLPRFRQNNWFTAFGEGWALYAERLPKEVGFYQDPYSDFGRLIYDAWRACRLVVDVGLHYYRWDRQKAINFMKEHFGGTDQNIISEVDRYIAWPGQALGYKIGQLKILELRAKAEKALGEKFSIKEFHNQVLNEGNIPLPALENKINAWIERETHT